MVLLGGHAMKRKNRYIVIKRTDLDSARSLVTPTTFQAFESVINLVDAYRKSRLRGPLCCVVVEHDWPEYEPTWRAIAARVDTKHDNEEHY